MYKYVDQNAKGPNIVEKTFNEINSNELLLDKITFQDFKESLKKTKASVSKESLVLYENFTK